MHSPQRVDPGDPVVVDPLIPLEIPLTIWLHQEGLDSKGIISQDKVWHWLVMFGCGG